LQSIASLSDSELAPAVGLVLKLASESTFSRTAAVHSVRQRVNSRPEVAGGTLDAIRLAVTQHSEVAIAMLADIDSDLRNSKPAACMEVCPPLLLAPF
jgi:hypothetical protein